MGNVNVKVDVNNAENSNPCQSENRKTNHVTESSHRGHVLESTTKLHRSASGADVTEKYQTQLVPIEKLSQILKVESGKYGVEGIHIEAFVSQVFPEYPDLARRLFRFLHQSSKATTAHLGVLAFRQQCERFLGIMDDSKVLSSYIKMYAQPNNLDYIDEYSVTELLNICYKIAMRHSGNALQCPAFRDFIQITSTFGSVTNAIFFNHDNLTLGYVSRWFEQNLIRIVLLVHRYCVHTLSTAYRGFEQVPQSSGIELQTPVLNQRDPFPDSKIKELNKQSSSTLLPLSQAWLLAGALPQLYTKPQAISSPCIDGKTSSQLFRDKLSIMPSHWTLLYDSREHGSGINRFLHHVLGYRGATLILLQTDTEHRYCIAAPSEWKETHLYTGGEGSCVIQLLPKFVLLEKKSNILYLNTSFRGYPKGLRAGSDPRQPLLSVDEQFEKVDFKGITSVLLAIEVWGCGDKMFREVQLDIQKWQIKEAERQRTVKLTAADWMDHPDRYLLELGGRQNYNN